MVLGPFPEFEGPYKAAMLVICRGMVWAVHKAGVTCKVLSGAMGYMVKRLLAPPWSRPPSSSPWVECRCGWGWLLTVGTFAKNDDSHGDSARSWPPPSPRPYLGGPGRPDA